MTADATVSKKRVKKFGSGRVNSTASTNRWVENIAKESESLNQDTRINAQYVDLDKVLLDPENPRKLALSLDDIRTVAHKLPINKAKLEEDGNEDYWEDYTHSAISLIGEGKEVDFSKLLHLATSIKREDNLLNPITLYNEGNSSALSLIAGERRYLAHVLLGLPRIAARIMDDKPDPLQKAILQWAENNQREDLSLHEKLLNLRALVEAWEANHTRMSVSKFMSLTGEPRVSSHRYLSVIRCTSPLLENAIQNGKVAFLTRAAELAAMSEAEIKAALSDKVVKPRSPVSFHRSVNKTTALKILAAAAEQLGGKDLLDQVNSVSLETRRDVGQAFELLVAHIEASQ